MGQYDKLPKELTALEIFCCWKREVVKGRPTKVPYSPKTGARAKTNEPAGFTDFGTAALASKKYSGIGIRVGMGICAIDLDHCIDDKGSIDKQAEDILTLMKGAYVEKSPSKTGIRIIFFAPDFAYDKVKYYINNQKFGVEVYAPGVTNRFVTITGDTLCEGSPLPDLSENLTILLDAYMKRQTQETQPMAVKKKQPSKGYLSDESVIEKASHAVSGTKFSRLMQGDTSDYGSQSEADLALCSQLAFWCGRDETQMDGIFRQSGLMRDKWDRKQAGSTYGELTIKKSLERSTETYSPGGKRMSAAMEFNCMDPVLLELRPDENPRYPATEIGASLLYADYFKDVARYVPERKMWFCYDKGRWMPDVGNLKAMELCKALANNLYLYALTIKEEAARTFYMDHCKRWQARRLRETVLKDAQSIYPISLSEFDKNIYDFNCKNGTLCLETMVFRPHNPEDKITKMANVNYDKDATCPRFDRYIEEIMCGDKDKAEFLQRVLGYGLSGDTKYECLFVLYGASTRNGKGTLCESIIKLMGSYGCTARPETISLKSNNNSGNPTEDVARLSGVRFVNISEPSRGLVLNAAQVKSMTGGDTINARFLHENSFDFSPRFKLYINANYLPVITDMTLFTSNRVVIIPFDRHFEEGEQDKSLKREFSKAKNQSAILNWLLQGYTRLCFEDLEQPASVRLATDSYRHDSDKVALFMEEELVQDENREIRTSEAYLRYQAWCTANGCYAENARNFRQALTSIARVERKRPKSGGGLTTMLVGYGYGVAESEKEFL